MIARATVIAALFFALSCRTTIEPDAIVTPSPHKVVKREAQDNPAYQELEKLKYASDLFEIIDYVALETTSESLLTNLHQVLPFGDRWVVLDATEGQVYLFARDGKFLEKVGRSGQGPGEYLGPTSLATWREQLVVTDAAAGQLLFYDEEGRFVRRIDSKNEGIAPGMTNLFDTDYWYAIDYSASKADVPNHLVVSLQEDSWQVEGGFGTRFPWIYRADVRNRFPSRVWSAATLVGERLWLGSPYGTEVELYDKEGRVITRLHPGIPDSLSSDDFRGVSNANELNELARSKYFNFYIIWIEPFVLVTYGRIGGNTGINLYDTEGNLVRKALKPGRHLNAVFRWAADGNLITTRPADLYPHLWQEMSRSEEYANLVERGFQPEQLKEDDNPILLISKIRDIFTL